MTAPDPLRDIVGGFASHLHREDKPKRRRKEPSEMRRPPAMNSVSAVVETGAVITANTEKADPVQLPARAAAFFCRQKSSS